MVAKGIRTWVHLIASPTSTTELVHELCTIDPAETHVSNTYLPNKCTSTPHMFAELKLISALTDSIKQ